MWPFGCVDLDNPSHVAVPHARLPHLRIICSARGHECGPRVTQMCVLFLRPLVMWSRHANKRDTQKHAKSFALQSVLHSEKVQQDITEG